MIESEGILDNLLAAMPLAIFHHRHNKRKDSLETLVVLLILSLDLKFLGWPYREYIKTAKNGCFHCFSEEFLSGNDFQAVLPLFVVTTMVPTLLRQLRRLLQIKKIVTNVPCML